MTNKKKFVVPEYFDLLDEEDIEDLLEYSHKMYVVQRAVELTKQTECSQEPSFFDELRGVTNCHVFEELNCTPKGESWRELAQKFEMFFNHEKATRDALMYALMAFKEDENHDACLFIRNRFQEMNQILLQLRRRKPTEDEKKSIDGFKSKIHDWNWWFQQDQKEMNYTREEYEHGNNEIIIEHDPSKEEAS